MIQEELSRQISSTGWSSFFKTQANQPYYNKLTYLLEQEYRNQCVYPKQEDIFKFLALTDFNDLKVIMIGQDPYHTPGMANGLAFSVNSGMKTPPSLQNIFKELKEDVGISRSNSDLSD